MQPVDDCHALNSEGVTRLSAEMFALARSWSVMAFTEMMHAKWNRTICEQLEALRPRWFEGVDEAKFRPGAWVADELSNLLAPHGIYISATHPSIEDESPWEASGPRFYASLIEAYRERVSFVPAPPPRLASLVWSVPGDMAAPWVTEIGWTIVPPHSDPQELHADIVNESGWCSNERTAGRSRYTHLVWKCAGEEPRECTTQLVKGLFSNGHAAEEDYERLESVGGACLVLDSEVTHRGGSTERRRDWSSSCTVQLCSTSGMRVLGDLIDASLLKHTLPVQLCADTGVACLPPSFEPSPPPTTGRAYPKHIRFEEEEDEDEDEGEASAATEAGTLSPHKRPRCASPVTLDSSDSETTSARGESIAEAPSDAGADAAEARSSQTTSPTSQLDEIAICETRAPLHGARGSPSLSSPASSPSAAECAALNAQLSTDGWAELRRGLPSDWASWALLRFVDECHAAWAPLVQAELCALGAQREGSKLGA